LCAAIAVEIVAVEAHRIDHLEPSRIVGPPLDEAAIGCPAAAGREHRARIGAIGDIDGVADKIAAIGHGVAERTGIEA
jgi:hypothetical protein